MTALQITMSKDEAERITSRIRLLVQTIAANTEKVVSLIEQAEAGEAWRAMAYPSWTAYVATEFSGSLKALEKAERMPVVEKLSESGMSTRAIASVVGVGKSTVDRDRQEQVSHTGTPAENIVGTDGKSYTRPASFSPSGRPDSRSTREMGEAVPAVAPKPRPRPLPAQYWDAVYDLQKAVERLVRLTEDDRFARSADDLYGRHADRLERLREQLHDQIMMPLVRGGGSGD
jgi:hypothetical protein